MLAPLLPLLALATAAVHDNSASSSRLVIEGATARLQLRCQLLSVQEVVEGLDADRDGLVARSELEARRDEILDYAGRHYVLRSGGGPDAEAGRRLQPRAVALSTARLDQRPWLASYDLVDVTLEFEDTALIRELSIAVDLFRTTSPDHYDYASIVWNGRAPVRVDFFPGSGSWVGTAPEGPARAFLTLGAWRGLRSWAALSLVLALLLASRGAREAAAVVAVFALAQAAGSALGVLGVLPLGERFLRLAGSLSIAYVGADNLLHRSQRPRWIEAGLFGLVHGLWTAVLLALLLEQERERLVGLVAFEAGFVAVQLTLVAACGVLLARLPRGGSALATPSLAPAWARTGGSTAALLLGLGGFARSAFGA